MKVFLSYKWEDDERNKWVETLARDLRFNGIDAKLDKWEVTCGQSFIQYMTSHISQADIVILIITEASVRAIESDSTGGALKFEVQLATSRRIAGDDFRFIGLLREGNHVPTHLRDYRYVDFRQDSNYTQNLETLVKDIFGVSDRPPVSAGMINLTGTIWRGVFEIHTIELEFLSNGEISWWWLVDNPGGGEICDRKERVNRWEQHGNIVSCVLNDAEYDGVINESRSLVSG